MDLPGMEANMAKHRVPRVGTMSDEQYGRLMEATTLTSGLRTLSCLRVTARNLVELGEIEVKLPSTATPVDMEFVTALLETEGYTPTAVGFNASRTVRVVARGW